MTTVKSSEDKIRYINFLKVVGINGVIFYHCVVFFSGNPYWLMKADTASPFIARLCTFFDISWVPLYALCSGFLFALVTDVKKRTMLAELGNRSRRLLVPYFLTGIFWLVPTYTIFDFPSFGRPEHAGLLEGYKAMFLGEFSDHLWFLLILFWTSLTFILLKPLCRKKFLVPLFFASTAVALVDVFFLKNISYYKISQFHFMIWPFFCGIFCYFFREWFITLKPWILWIFIIAGMLVCAYFVIFPYTVFWQEWIAKSVTAVMLYLFGVWLEKTDVMKKICKGKFWDFSRENNLYLYLFNLPVPHFFFMIFSPRVRNTFLLCLLVVVCSFITIYLIVWGVSSARKFLLKKAKGGEKYVSKQ